jgi:hypothetical protein
VRERGGRGGVGQVVGGNVDGLEGGDGALFGGGDAFLEVTHFGGEGGLVTDGGGGTAEEGGHLGTGLGEPEDVVDEEQHVLVLFVTEVLGDGEGREGDAEAGSGRFVHLAVDQTDAGAFLEDGEAVRPFTGCPLASFFTLMTPASTISL